MVEENQLPIAEYILDKFNKMIEYPDRAISIRYNVKEILEKLGITSLEKDGRARDLREVVSDLEETILEIRGS